MMFAGQNPAFWLSKMQAINKGIPAKQGVATENYSGKEGQLVCSADLTDGIRPKLLSLANRCQ